MNVLITGGFGKLGIAVIDECLAREHKVTVFDIRNKKNSRTARKYRRRLTSVFPGDVRRFEEIKKAVEGQDAVIHLAGITPPATERNPQTCRDINIGGTKNVIEAVKAFGGGAKIVYISTATVMGPAGNGD